jgi:hypothetical protein
VTKNFMAVKDNDNHGTVSLPREGPTGMVLRFWLPRTLGGGEYNNMVLTGGLHSSYSIFKRVNV